MDMIKICKVCGKENDAENLTCGDCTAEISSIKAIPKSEKVEPKEIIELKVEKNIQNHTLRIPTCNLLIGNDSIKIINDCTLGREAHGNEILRQFLTVSRQHVEISFIEDSWKVKDLNTTNGTYVNNRKLNADVYTNLENGDELSLSSQLKIKVEIV